MGVVKLGKPKKAKRAQDREDRTSRPGPNVRMGLPDLRGKVGHPTLLTEELIEEFARLLPTVAYIEVAGDLLGISGKTWKNWIVDGRGEQRNIDTVPGYVPDPKRALTLRFFRAYRAALAEYQYRNLSGIAAAGPRDWRAYAWLQERRFYEQWSDKARDIAELRKQLDEMEKSLVKTRPTPVSELTKEPLPQQETEDGRDEGTERDPAAATHSGGAVAGAPQASPQATTGPG